MTATVDAEHHQTVRRRRTSFRTRLSLLVALAVGFAVAMGALASYLLVHHDLISQVDQSLAAQVHTDVQLGPDGLIVRATGDDQDWTWFIDPSGSAQPFTPANTDEPTLVTTSGMKTLALAQSYGSSMSGIKEIGGIDYRYIVVSLGGPLDLTVDRLAVGSFQSGALVIAHPLTDIDRTLSDLRLILFLVGLVWGGLGPRPGLRRGPGHDPAG
jgi:hypothetical protein